MTAQTKQYEIYAGIGSTDSDVELIESEHFDNVEEAREYARFCAFGLYNLDPKRDIFEIMEEDKVSQDVAVETFNTEMEQSVIFFVIEYDVDFHGNKVMIVHR